MNNNNNNSVSASSSSFNSTAPKRLHGGFWEGEDLLLSTAVDPPVTVVVEGRSICQRINLQNHDSYISLANALRHMFDEYYGDIDHCRGHNEEEAVPVPVVDIANAIPGYVVAYEDIENDLLLAGDLSWNDFVRVAKRIRILPAKSKNQREGKRRIS